MKGARIRNTDNLKYIYIKYVYGSKTCANEPHSNSDRISMKNSKDSNLSSDEWLNLVILIIMSDGGGFVLHADYSISYISQNHSSFCFETLRNVEHTFFS